MLSMATIRAAAATPRNANAVAHWAVVLEDVIDDIPRRVRAATLKPREAAILKKARHLRLLILDGTRIV